MEEIRREHEETKRREEADPIFAEFLKTYRRFCIATSSRYMPSLPDEERDPAWDVIEKWHAETGAFPTNEEILAKLEKDKGGADAE